MSDVEGLVVTGVHGVGKSSVVEEMAGLLEEGGIAYAAMDVDWLCWFDVPGIYDADSRKILFANIESVTENYRGVGVSRFLFAWSIPDQAHLQALRECVPLPLRVICLTAPIDVIRARLQSAPTAGRQQDLLMAEKWLHDRIGSDPYEVNIESDRPIRDVAIQILDLVGWR